jgi:hypothetical protein
MSAKLHISQKLWKLYASIGSLGSASIFTTKIIFKSKFSSAREFKNDFLKWLAHKNGRLKT